MQRTDLLSLAGGASSWSELEAKIAGLPSEQVRGEVFEEFCKVFFLLDPVFQFKEVYRQREIPPSIRQKLGYPGVQDIGIDGLAITIDGKLVAYQAKFRSDRTNTPTLRELSTFFTVSDRADWRITIANANNLPTAINDRTNQSRILSDRLDQLDPEFFERLRVYLKEQCVNPPKIKPPHKTQQEAIEAALLYFTENDRGQLILPCGTGKTLAAMWIAEKLVGPRVLVMVPSLSLMSQTLREWAANTSIRPFRYLCLCSDTTVDLGNDSPIEHLYEMDVPVTTDVKVVAEYLANAPSITSILFSTYQSSKVLSEAALKSDTTFDMAIFDEAHRTTGTKVGVWSLALDDKNVQIKKRLFMTATPRIYAPHIVKKAKDEDVLLCSMDDEAVYGKPFYEITFGTAIERGHITDYKIVVICVTDSEVREIMHRGGRVIIDNGHEWDAKAFAKRVALVKGIKKYGLKKVFTFHGKVKSAKAFTDTNTPYGIHQVFKILEGEGEKVKNSSPEKMQFFHVNGTMPSGVRNSLMKEFKESEIGIMSNARCLTEGVDVPTVDTVAFIDPKRSLIDIVQATGRGMRNAEWKERGYIFIPVVVEEDDDPERFIESSDFETVWKVLQSMIDQDQRLESIVSNLKIMQGKGEEGTRAWKDAMTEYAEKVEFSNLPTSIDKARFINTLYTKTIELIGSTWDKRYGELMKYKERFGHCNVSKDWAENPSLGLWVSNQRNRKTKLTRGQIDRLNNLNFVWDPQEALWEEMFLALVEHKNTYGHCNVQQKGYKNPQLGKWINRQRRAKKEGSIAQARMGRLNGLGFIWNIKDRLWEEMFAALTEYRTSYGHCNVPDKWAENPQLARWVGKQRQKKKKNKLRAERIARLASIGFIWDVKEALWAQMLEELIEYKKLHSHCNVPFKYPKNPKLGRWVNWQRFAFKKKRLDEEYVKRLNAIGFVWSHDEAFWEEMFEALVNYGKLYGHCNVPDSKSGNRQLGTWVSNQRKRKNKLGVERTRRLDQIGFYWRIKQVSDNLGENNK